MRVRKATVEDLDKVVVLGEGFYDQTQQAEFTTYNPEAVRELLRTMIESPALSTVLVAETDAGEVVGMTGGILYPLWMSPEHLTGQEMFWYVHPDHRKSKAGKRLFDALEQWAKDSGAKSFCMVALSHLHEKRIGQMYESKGYVPMERNYIKVL